MSKSAATSTPIHPVLAARWSPRAFAPDRSLSMSELTPAFEAARWAPSAFNVQPWSYIVGFQGDATFERIAAGLNEWNRAWASHAHALVVTCYEPADADGKPNPYALYDLGQSVASFSFQAHSDGLYVHQMAGLDAEQLRSALNIPDNLSVFHVFAVGHLGDPEILPEKLAAREREPRTRRELSAIVRQTPFGID